MIVRDEKEVADVNIENPPPFHVGAWKCWIGETSGELEDVPWRSKGGALLGETTSSSVEGRIQFLLAKLDARVGAIKAPSKVIGQYEQQWGIPAGGNAALSFVSLYGWIRRDGQSRWISVEKWHNPHRMQLIEMFFRQRRAWLRTMWEYAGTNTSELGVSVEDVERGLAMGWINGKLQYVTGGDTTPPDSVYVMVEFSDEGSPKEVRLRMGRDAEPSWIVEKAQWRSQQDAGRQTWRLPGIEEDAAPSGLWDRLEMERKSFEVGEVLNP